MDTGLKKLEEASACVAILKNELANMEKELALASKKAEDVLLEVTERASQAETVKNQVKFSFFLNFIACSVNYY